MRQLTEAQTDRLLDDVDELRHVLTIPEAGALYVLAEVAPELRQLLGTLAGEVSGLAPWEVVGPVDREELRSCLVPWLALGCEAGAGLARADYDVEV